jgi:hypothetical protein
VPLRLSSTSVSRFIDSGPRYIQQIRLESLKPDKCGKLKAGKLITLLKCFK